MDPLWDDQLKLDISDLFNDKLKHKVDVPLYRRTHVHNVLRDLVQQMETHRRAAKLLTRLRCEGPWPIDHYDVDTHTEEEVAEFDHTVMTLLRKGLIHIDYLVEPPRLILGSKPLFIDHPRRGFVLWEAAFGGIYYVALQAQIEGPQDVYERVRQLILQTEGITEDELNETGGIPEDLHLLDREDAIRIVLTTDSDPPYKTLWQMFCETDHDEIIGCSEW
jgi:hypothetical protein